MTPHHRNLHVLTHFVPTRRSSVLMVPACAAGSTLLTSMRGPDWAIACVTAIANDITAIVERIFMITLCGKKSRAERRQGPAGATASHGTDRNSPMPRIAELSACLKRVTSLSEIRGETSRERGCRNGQN